MFKLPYEDIVASITQKTGTPKEDIEKRVSDKLKLLSGLISKEGAAHIVANEMGVKLLEPFSGKLQIKNIMTGMRDVETSAKVMQVYELRQFNTNGRSGKVASMMVADETGSIRITMWGDQADAISQIRPGDVVTIMSGYVRENMGRKELHLNERSKLLINPAGVSINVSVQQGQSSSASTAPAQRKSIKELTGSESAVEVLGTLVQLYEPRFFEVCPQCQKRTKASPNGFECAQHGAITPAFSYVLNGMVDDGTESIRVVFFREQASSLLGMNDNGVLTLKDAPGQFEPIKTELLGNIVKIAGKVVSNQMFNRLELVARNVDTNPDPKAELARMGN